MDFSKIKQILRQIKNFNHFNSQKIGKNPSQLKVQKNVWNIYGDTKKFQ